MSIKTHSALKNGSDTILTSEILRRERRLAKVERGLSIADFARILGLRNRSSLLRYELGMEKGGRAISKKLARRFEEWKRGAPAEVISHIPIPPGTWLPDRAMVAQCKWCGKNFVSMHKSRQYHGRSCQLKAWRAQRKGK